MNSYPTQSQGIQDVTYGTTLYAAPFSQSSSEMYACQINAYDGATSRLVRSETTGQPATTYLYDERGEMAATVQSGVKTASETRYENIGGAWWRVDVRSTSHEGVTNAVATTRRQLTGLSNALRSRTVSIDPNGSTTTETSSFNPQTCELTTIRATDAATPLVAVSKFGRPIRRETLRETVYNYFDPLGRVEYSEVSNPEAGSYSRWSGLDESDNETDYVVHYYYGEDYYVVGSRTFDAFNRETSHTDTFGNTITTTYDALGRPVGASGATYPVRNEYDTANRTTALSTTRDGTAWDATHWNYDLPTGLVTNKVYADGSAVSYAYTPDGKLAARTWARGLATAYAYNPDGLLTGVSYSDGLSPLPLGEGQGEGAAPYSVTLAYDAFLRLASASNAVAAYAYANDALGTATNETVTLGGTVSTLTRGMDSRHRLAALRVGDAPPVQYGYDVENRLSTVSNSAFVAEYNYTSDGWDAGYGITLTNGVTLARNLTRDPYRRSLITAITNTVNGAATASLVYDYDKQNRVTSRNYDTFSYNARSEITAASVQSNAYAYAYDSIGNHTTASVNAATTAYTANNLNQYTTIDAITPSYDADGNMTWDGRFSYAYDAENRLIAAYSNTVCIVSNAYDHASRRVLKWTPCHTTTFVYDGWLPILEIIATASEVATNAYVWGKDLSGTMQGAGGVGGLLAVSLNGAWYFPFYDNNGNVIAYVDEQGVIVAEYTYDAFGGIIAASGSMSDTFRHRFSTKYYDAETRLYYYGMRFYSSELHRWLNRDPIEEKGGYNLYAFCTNNAANQMDVLGMATVKVYAWKPTTFWEKIKGSGNYKTVEIHSAEEVPINYAMRLGNAWGVFDDNHLVVVACDCADSVDIFPTITIQSGLPKQGARGVKYLFSKHQAHGGEVIGGGGYAVPNGNLVEGSIIEHERGHAQAFFELVLPRFRKAVETRFPGKLKSTDTREIRRLFLQARKDTIKEHIEMVFKREFEWYRNNGYTITEPASPGGYYEASF